MKKIFVSAIVLCVAMTSAAYAVSLSAIYDFRNQLDDAQTSFEGLDFTNDGTLWITSSPNNGADSLLAVDLKTQTVTSQQNTGLLNPVGLASDGEKLFIANNAKGFFGFDSRDPVYTGTIDSLTGQVGLAATPLYLASGACLEPEGSAYMNGALYFSCEKGKSVIKVDATGKVVEKFTFDNNLLGLGATEDRLIVGDYKGKDERRLLLYDVVSKQITQTIDLNELFVGAQSDYAKLTGQEYEVTIADNGDIRYIPDPDGIAYRNGKIYMTFEHDLRVYEISLTTTTTTATTTPEPGTMLLIGLGLVGVAALNRRRN